MYKITTNRQEDIKDWCKQKCSFNAVHVIEQTKEHIILKFDYKKHLEMFLFNWDHRVDNIEEVEFEEFNIHEIKRQRMIQKVKDEGLDIPFVF